MYRLIFIILILLPSFLFSQSGPGGIGSTDGNSALSLWLKFDSTDVDLPSGEIDRWRDESGKNNDLSSQPLESKPFLEMNQGYPCLYFDGNDFLQMGSYSSDFNNTEQTIFIVTSETNRGAIISIAKGEWNNEFLVFEDAIFHHNYSGNFTYQTHNCISGSEPLNIIMAQFGSQAEDILIKSNNTISDQQIITRGNPKEYSNTRRRVTLGQRGKFVHQEFLTGYIYEVIVYNRKLNSSEVNQVHEYLQCKFPDLADYCSSFPPSSDCIYENNVACDEAFTLHPTLIEDHTTLSPFDENVNVRIYNSIGQIVFIREPLLDPRILFVGRSPGVYYCQVYGNCKPTTIKVIKVR